MEECRFQYLEDRDLNLIMSRDPLSQMSFDQKEKVIPCILRQLNITRCSPAVQRYFTLIFVFERLAGMVVIPPKDNLTGYIDSLIQEAVNINSFVELKKALFFFLFSYNSAPTVIISYSNKTMLAYSPNLSAVALLFSSPQLNLTVDIVHSDDEYNVKSLKFESTFDSDHSFSHSFDLINETDLITDWLGVF